MAVTSHVYTKVADSLGQKKIDIDSDTIKVMLLSAYTVGTTQDTAQFVSDVKAAGTEAVGTGYTAGGATLATVSWSRSGHVYTLDFSVDPSWNATGGALAAAYAVFYAASAGTDSTNPVICYWDLGGTQTATNGTFTLTLDAAGVLTVTGS